MKESLQKITAWIKAHPWAAAAIGVVLLVVGYFVIKSTGGNSDGESLGMSNSTPSGTSETGDPLAGLGGLGSAAASMPAVTTSTDAATPAESSIVDSFPSIGGGGDSSSFDMGISSGYDSTVFPDAGIFSGPTTSESIISGGMSPVGAAVNNMLTTASVTSSPQITASPKTQTTQAPKSNLKATATATAGKSSTVNSVTPKSNLKATATATAKSAPAKPSNIVKKAVVTTATPWWMVLANINKAITRPASKPVGLKVSGVATLKPKSTTAAKPAAKVAYTGYRPGYYWNGSAYIPVKGR